MVFLRTEGKEGLLERLQLSYSTQVLSRTQRGPIHSPAPRYGPSEDPPRTRRVISASLKASPPSTSTAHRVSASLDDSGSTLGRADQLRLAQGRPSADETNNPSAHLPVRRRQAAMPHSSCDRGPVHQLRSLLRHLRHCINTVGTCGRRARCCSRHCAANPAYFFCCRTFDRHGHDPRTRSRP